LQFPGLWSRKLQVYFRNDLAAGGTPTILPLRAPSVAGFSRPSGGFALMPSQPAS
jgi:hypothetical protein